MNVRWQHIAGIDLPLVTYGDEEWVPIAGLAKSLGVPAYRIRAACASPLNYGRVRTANLEIDQMWALCASRASLIHLAHRMRPGTNNALLRFVHNAEEVSMGVSVDLIASRSVVAAKRVAERDARLKNRENKARQQADAIVEMVKAFDDGADLKDLERRWLEKTGLGAASLHKALRGGSDTAAHRLALGSLQRPSPRRFGGVAPRGRKPRLTKELILQILRSRGDLSRATAARQFNTSEEVVKQIWDGTYCTQAMRDALVIWSKP